MPAKRPSGARNETIRCEYCGEDYAVTYKHCPFCEDDEPTRIFRRPQAAPPPRESERPVRPATRPAREEEPDEYEQLLSRRAPKAEVPPPAPQDEDEEYEERRSRATRRRDEDEEYEERRSRATRRRDEDEDDDEEPRRRSRRDEDYDDEDEDDDYEPRGRRGDGGKRLVTNARGGGYRHRGPSPAQIIGAVLSVALVAVAAYVVFLIVKPFFAKDDPSAITPPNSSQTVTIPPTPSLSDQPSLNQPTDAPPTGDVGVQPPSVGDSTPPPVVTTIPEGQTATGFSLGKTEFTLSDQYPTYTFKVAFIPEGTTGSITWHSSKPNIVTVDANGKVSGVAQGVATITATMAGGYTRECMVRSTIGGAPAADPSPSASVAPPSTSVAPSTSASPSASPSAGGALTLNVGLGLDGKTYDFSLSGAGDSWTLKVKGATGAVTWSTANSSVATVDANGKVTAVGNGNTKITATVDGQTLECVVRVKL